MSGEFAVYPSLRDRVVFITGGASGIGAEHVTQFAAQGAKVAFVDIADDVAQATARPDRGGGPSGAGVPALRPQGHRGTTARRSPRSGGAWDRSPCW